jgi:hypothetical protein
MIPFTTRFHSFTDGHILSVWLAIRRWFIYRHLHRRIMSVGFPFVDDSQFRRYINRKNKKNHLPMVLQTEFAHQKKVSCLKYTDGFCFIGDIVLYRWYVSISKCVSECLRYRPNISVCKFIGKCGSYCQMPTD